MRTVQRALAKRDGHDAALLLGEGPVRNTPTRGVDDLTAPATSLRDRTPIVVNKRAHCISWIHLKVENGCPPDPARKRVQAVAQYSRELIVPSPVFFHLPAIQYMPCLSITTEFDGPAFTWAPMVISFGPANCGTILGVRTSF